jgi:MFS family permease
VNNPRFFRIRSTDTSEDAGRALTGLACGFITATVPSYIAELSIPSIRGILTGLFEVTYQIGSVIGFWINYGITQTMSPASSTSWRIPMAVQIIPGGLLLIGCFFIHESPLWLMRKNKQEETNRTLQELRGLPVEHQCECPVVLHLPFASVFPSFPFPGVTRTPLTVVAVQMCRKRSR